MSVLDQRILPDLFGCLPTLYVSVCRFSGLFTVAETHRGIFQAMSRAVAMVVIYWLCFSRITLLHLLIMHISVSSVRIIEGF